MLIVKTAIGFEGFLSFVICIICLKMHTLKEASQLRGFSFLMKRMIPLSHESKESREFRDAELDFLKEVPNEACALRNEQGTRARGRNGSDGKAARTQVRMTHRLRRKNREARRPRTSAPAIASCQGILHCSPAPEIKE